MENDNSQQSFCGHESVINPATHSHQDIDHATLHNLPPVEGRERELGQRTTSGHLEAAVNAVVRVTSESGGGGEQQRERVSSPERAGQVQKDASTNDASPMFKPLPDSVLHSALQSPQKKHTQEPLFRPSPPSEEEESTHANNDVISLHSTDSEAASDTEEAIVVEESLFTPPPVTEDDDPPLAYIRSLPSKSKKPTRYVMTHVEVPPLRRPKSDYKDTKDIFPSKPRRKEPKQGQAHSSLLEALQFQMAHNSEIHDEEDMIVEKLPPKKKRKSMQRNAVAGPSRLPPSSDSLRTKPKPKRRLIDSSSSGDEVAASSSSRGGLVSNGKGVEAARKRQKVTIDLTMDQDDEDDEGTPAVRSTRRSPSRAASTTPQPVYQTLSSLGPKLSPVIQNADRSAPIGSSAPSVSFRRPSFDSSCDWTQDHKEYQRLNLRVYPHSPPSILHVNTRFHRERLRNNTHADSVISSSLSTTGSPERNGVSAVPTSRRFPWGGLMGGHSPRNNLGPDDDTDFILLGYAPLGPHRIDFENDDPDADVPTLLLERQPPISPFVEDVVRPVKSDLAAELEKRKLAKGKQKQTQRNQASFPSGSNRDLERPDGGELVASLGSKQPLTVPFGGIFSPNSSPLKLGYPTSDDLHPHPPSPLRQHQHSDHLQTYLNSPLPASSTACDIGFEGPPSTNAPPYAIRRPHGDLDVFMHDYTARPPSPDPHLQITSGGSSTAANASSLASFSTAVGVGVGDDPYSNLDSLTLQQGPLVPAANSTTMPGFFQSDKIFLAASEAGPSQRSEADAMFPSSTVFDGGLAALSESWMTTGKQHVADYGYDTVDPTLIFGGVTNYHDGAVFSASAGELESSRNGLTVGLSGATGKECTSSDDDREEAGIASMLNNISKAGSRFSGHSGKSSVRFQSSPAQSSSSSSSRTSSVAALPTSLTSLDGSPSSQSSGLSNRLETPAPVNPLPTSLSSALSSVKETLGVINVERSRRFVTRSESSPLSDLTTSSGASSVVAPIATRPNATTSATTNTVQVVIGHKPRTPASGWEEHTLDDQIYCHQCRSKNNHPKTRCACRAKYCSRCISVRPKYIQVLKPGGRVYSCPRCEQWCTCTSCCKKRGEVYVRASAESTAQPPSIVPTPARTPPLSSTPHLPSPLPIHGYIFRPPSSRRRPARHTVEDLPSFPVTSRLSLSMDPGPSSQPTSEPLAPIPKKKARVFIGKVQQSWGLGKRLSTRELNPAPRAVWPKNPTGPCTVRYYIGSTDFLQHKQMGLESTDDLLAGLTSVASLEESDPENVDDAASSTCREEELTANNDKSELPSPALCQRDVARAISATYESFGHTVILSEELRQ